MRCCYSKRCFEKIAFWKGQSNAAIRCCPKRSRQDRYLEISKRASFRKCSSPECLSKSLFESFNTKASLYSKTSLHENALSKTTIRKYQSTPLFENVALWICLSKPLFENIKAVLFFEKSCFPMYKQAAIRKCQNKPLFRKRCQPKVSMKDCYTIVTSR